MKIQERCCHGFKASSCSQRQIVDADASVSPRWMTSRCSSLREKRLSGSPCVAGSSQASAFTSAICSGGKTARAARALTVLELGQLLAAQLDHEPAPPRHDHSIRRPAAGPFNLPTELPDGCTSDRETGLHYRKGH